MFLEDLEEQFVYWRKNPPFHEFAAAFARAYLKWSPPITPEEAWQAGAMNPADFAAWVEATGGEQVQPGG